jgi:hypothetical protein
MERDIPEIDEQWIAEWVTFGLRELERYLCNQRSFDEYYTRRSRDPAVGGPWLDD